MKKETIGEVVAHPLWMLPVMLLSLLLMIEGIHTTAHWYMEMDVHGYCMRNKEHVERIEQGDDNW